MRKILEKLFEQQTLAKDEARQALLGAMQGDVPPAQVASFLTVFRMRPLTLDELDGFREALMEKARKIDLASFNPIDVCGTGGDGKSSFNVSTLAAFVVAACGIPVAKHGNYAVSSLCGSSNVLEELGARFTADESILKRQIEGAGICFFHAPLFHPSMKAVAPVRKELGLKTFFNLLGPLVNPCSPAAQLCGVYSLEVLRIYAYLALRLNKHFCVVHSLDGFDEVSLTARFKVSTPLEDKTYDPHDLKLERIAPSAISAGKDTAESAEIFKTILGGKGTREQIAVVAVNAGFAIKAAGDQRGQKRELLDCIQEAEFALASGAARQTFKKFLEIQP